MPLVVLDVSWVLGSRRWFDPLVVRSAVAHCDSADREGRYDQVLDCYSQQVCVCSPLGS